MKKFYSLVVALALFSSGALMSQTYHNVDVSNFAFTPQQLEIHLGDTVVWTNSLGQHSVDGNGIDFPENPESFGNDVGPAGWTYEFIFTQPGVYNYKCGVHASMTGSVIVSENPLGISEVENATYFAFFPNPVVDLLSWKWNENKPLLNARMVIYDTQGKKIDQFSMNDVSSHDVSSYSEGIYTFVLIHENEKIQTGKILINR